MISLVAVLTTYPGRCLLLKVLRNHLQNNEVIDEDSLKKVRERGDIDTAGIDKNIDPTRWKISVYEKLPNERFKLQVYKGEDDSVMFDSRKPKKSDKVFNTVNDYS